MTLSQSGFKSRWAASGESQEPHAIDTAWRRYQQVQSSSHKTVPESNDLSTAEVAKAAEALCSQPSVSRSIATHTVIPLPATTIPWKATGLHLKQGQQVSVWASGRVWRSRLLDLYLKPQFALWYKVGVQGTAFNSTGDSGNFFADQDGELYVASIFPGMLSYAEGGRVVSGLSNYEKTEGGFTLLVFVWKDGFDVSEVLRELELSEPGAQTMVSTELERLQRDEAATLPEDWKYLWFLGKSSIYSTSTSEGQPCMHCRPHETVGIIQKTYSPAIPFYHGTRVSWDWCISALPSRLREDTTFTHDYLSIAFEFENGRDLTYTWSWELPEEYGYWCPLPTWEDREYHVVIRSGTEQLGKWLSERRDLYADYVKYIEEGREDKERMPKQITKVWFIAGNWFQKHEGDMKVKKLRIREIDVL